MTLVRRVRQLSAGWLLLVKIACWIAIVGLAPPYLPVEAKLSQSKRASAQTHGARVALVIGINEYENVPRLSNARSDAAAVAERLESAGFAVRSLFDPTYDALMVGVSSFLGDLKSEPSNIAVVYYAGHGGLVDGVPTMLMRSVKGETVQDLRGSGIALNGLLDEMHSSLATLNLVMFDACLERLPDMRQTYSAISIVAPPRTILSFASSVGACPRDQEQQGSQNGAYAAEFLRASDRVGASVKDVLDQMEQRVPVSTRGEQTPWRVMTGPEDAILWSAAPGATDPVLPARAPEPPPASQTR